VAEPFTHSLRVRWAECDPQGVVFNANYLLYFDLAVTELWREAIGPWNRLTERGLDAVVAEAGVRYRRPLRFDEEFTVQALVERIGTTSFTVGLTIVRDGEVCAEGILRYVMIDAASGEKTPVPGDIRAALAPWTAEAAAEPAA